MANDKNCEIPRVRVVGDQEPGLVAKVQDVLEPGREQAVRAVSFVFGMWPLFAIFALMLLLGWSFAMFQSP